MIIGGCPYCDASQYNSYAGPGQFQRIECDECHKIYWLRHSNFDPEAFTEEDFAERFEIDHEKKTIKDKALESYNKSRAENPEIWKLIDAKMEEGAKQLAKKLEAHFLYGEPLVSMESQK